MRSIRLFVICAGLVMFFVSPFPAFGCNVCHSKNPKMVRMHAELEYKDCFVCHGSGKIRPKNELPKQMKEDPLCIRCHKK